MASTSTSMSSSRTGNAATEPPAAGSVPPAGSMQTEYKEGRNPIRALPSELTVTTLADCSNSLEGRCIPAFSSAMAQRPRTSCAGERRTRNTCRDGTEPASLSDKRNRED